MKDIIFVVHSFDASYIGGVLKITSDLANSLSLRGFNVKILSLGRVYKPAFALNENIILESLDIEKYSTQFYKGLKKIFWFKEAYKVLIPYLSQNINSIFILSSPPLNIIFSLLKLKYSNTRMVGCDHTSTSYKMNSLIGALKFNLYNRLDKFIALTEQDNKFYLSKGIQSIYIPNFIYPIKNSYKGRAKNYLLFVGRFSLEKRPLLALEIYKKSKLWEKGVKFRMFGEGPLYDEMKNFININALEEHIEIIQKVSDPNIIYKDAYALIMTSSVEGFGMVLLEAISRNIPSIAFDVKYGPRTIIQHGVNGFLVEDGDLDNFNSYLNQIAWKIPETINDSIMHFNIDNVILSWIQLFSDLEGEKL